MSSLRHLTPVGGTLFFVNPDSSVNYDLWKSDGTTTRPLWLPRDGPPVQNPENGQELTAMDGTLYFRSGFDLWKSDGTVAGTGRIRGFSEPIPSSYFVLPSFLTPMGGSLFFQGYSPGRGYELMKSNGTEAGTVMVKDIATGSSSFPVALTVAGGELYFSAEDGNGRELWKSDGTEAGTVRVKDIVAGPGSSTPLSLTAVAGKLFFKATDENGNIGLWKSDGTEAGTMRVKDISPGTGGAGVPSMIAAGESLYFIADDGIHGSELWKSDGTEAGTTMVADLMAGPEGSSPMNLKMAGSRLFFSAATDTLGRELYVLDLSPPDIQLEVSEVAFGEKAVNRSGDLPVILKNVGKEADLGGIAATLSGPNANQFSIQLAPAGSVGGGQQTSVTVRFTPTSVGPKTAMLSIASNDADESLVTLAVTGTGITPYLAWVQSEGVTGGAGGHDDADGLSNLLEFSFGTHPRVSQSDTVDWVGGTVVRGVPTVGRASPSTEIYQGVYARRIDRASSGLTYSAQFSPDLTTWYESFANPIVLADDGEIQIVSVPFPQWVDGQKPRFFRVRVNMP